MTAAPPSSDSVDSAHPLRQGAGARDRHASSPRERPPPKTHSRQPNDVPPVRAFALPSAPARWERLTHYPTTLIATNPPTRPPPPPEPDLAPSPSGSCLRSRVATRSYRPHHPPSPTRPRKRRAAAKPLPRPPHEPHPAQGQSGCRWTTQSSSLTHPSVSGAPPIPSCRHTRSPRRPILDSSICARRPLRPETSTE